VNIAWWLSHSAREAGEKVASIDADGTEYTFAELHEQASRFAAVLASEFGVKEDDTIVSLAPEGGRHLALMYGTLQAGGIFAALNAGLLSDRLAQQARTAGAKIVVAAPQHVFLARRILEVGGLDAVVSTLGPNDHGLPDLLALAAAATPDYRVVSRAQDDAAAINFTAGTSGHSKGVTMTHGTLSVSAQGAMFTSGLGCDSVNLSLIGMYHSGGLHDAVKFVMCGGTIVWSGGWDPARVVTLMLRYRPNWVFFIVPTMLRDLMKRPEWNDLPLAGMGMYVAGEPVPEEVALKLEARGARYANAYGMTETMPFRITGPGQSSDGRAVPGPLGSSGRPRTEFCEVALKEPGTGELITEPEAEGEVCVRGDIVTPGYFHDTALTRDAVDQGGWLHTKDVAYRDKDGWYFLCGRTDDTINSGGEKLSLLELDNMLLAHSDILDAACVGVAHTRFGQVAAAFVVLRERLIDEDVAVRKLDEYMIATVERWKRPRLYVFVSEIPRTPAKRTKSFPELRAIIKDIIVRDEDAVLSLVPPVNDRRLRGARQRR
jgi:acyl-CoA synthetase (AMP-forming)/AMP-acid ligase II